MLADIEAHGSEGLVWFNASPEDQLWFASTTSGAVSVQPASNENVVVTGSSDGTLDAFAANRCGNATCPSLWTHNIGGNINGGLAIALGKLYAGGTTGLFAFASPK